MCKQASKQTCIDNAISNDMQITMMVWNPAQVIMRLSMSSASNEGAITDIN